MGQCLFLFVIVRILKKKGLPVILTLHDNMSLAGLKEQAAALPPDEQAELAAYLGDQLRRDDPEYRRALAKLIDDPDPNN